MNIAIASDHVGYQIKQEVINFLKQSGYDCDNFGTDSEISVDYPDFAFKVSEAVSCGKYQKGILICATGLGMAVAANKVKGIRAVNCNDNFTAEMSRRHNNANILCLGAKILKKETLLTIIKIWLETPFESENGTSRHQRRLNKISAYEDGH
jgi:ribose 5-phosphate isomerase B